MFIIFGQQMGSVKSEIQQNSKRVLLGFIIFTSLHLVMPVRSFIQQTYQRNKMNESMVNDLHLNDLLKRSADKNWEEIDPNCGIYRHQSLHAVMDRVCELCHEMFSYEENSLRAECRKNCFRNRKFRTCLQIFSPSTNGAGNKHTAR
uniref:FLZ-type domain-containing protein n=1 Tax=Setaria digitata TaxID=48799 RepID=A0A915PZC5_9BILA